MDFLKVLNIRKVSARGRFVSMPGLDFDDPTMETLARGTAGFVAKTERPGDVVSAVRDALSSGTGLSPSRVTKLVKISLGRHRFPGH